VARQSGNTDAAIASWRKAVALDATNFDALYNLCIVLLAANRAGEARPHVEQFVRTAPPGVYGREIAEFRKWLQ
jgi:cytochrome c-type biogenesis protein CcmH/NrfG